MGLDVLSVRCHRHNTSHSALGVCPLCEHERSERHAAEQLELERVRLEAEQVEREHAAAVEQCKGCAAAAALPPVLLPPGEPEPQHVQAALDRLNGSELIALLGELELWKVARKAGTNLHRYPIHAISLAPCMTQMLQLQAWEVSRLVRLDFSCDEGERLLALVNVGRVCVGTRQISNGGTLAQLNRCPLAREVLTPPVGGIVDITNNSNQRVTLRGVVVVEVLSPAGRVRAQQLDALDALEPWELERFSQP